MKKTRMMFILGVFIAIMFGANKAFADSVEQFLPGTQLARTAIKTPSDGKVTFAWRLTNNSPNTILSSSWYLPFGETSNSDYTPSIWSNIAEGFVYKKSTPNVPIDSILKFSAPFNDTNIASLSYVARGNEPKFLNYPLHQEVYSPTDSVAKVNIGKILPGQTVTVSIDLSVLRPDGTYAKNFGWRVDTEIFGVVVGNNVTARYLDEDGKLLSDDIILSGNIDDMFSTEQKEITGYTFKEVQGNPTGTFSYQDQTVTYIYTRNQGTADITYIDDTTKEVLSVKDLSGYTGEKAGYTTADTIKSYEEQGYVLVSDNYPKDDVTFTDNIQHYEVHLSHKVNTVTENKSINETIHYVYSDGTKASEDYKATPLEFTRTVSTDVVTGEVTYGDWTPEQSFKSVNSPKIDGYTPDKAQIEKQVVRYDSKDLDFTVTYTKTPTTPTTPNNTDSTLPMTGETRSGFAIVIGLAILFITGLILAKLRFSKKSK